MQALPLDHAAELLGVSRRRVYEGRLRTIRARYGSQRVLVESIEAVLWLKAEQLRVRRAGAAATGVVGTSRH